MMDFKAPGPGTWNLETTHFCGASPRYATPLFVEGLRRGFSEGMVTYGMPAKELNTQIVNGFAYARQIMLAEPEVPPTKPPPGWLMYIMTRIHPAFRERNRNALRAIKERTWEKELAEWDECKPDSIARNLTLANVDIKSMSDEALIDHIVACRNNLAEMYYRHHKWSITATYPIGRYLHITTRTEKVTPGEAIALLKGSTPVSKGAFAEELAVLARALADAGATTDSLSAVAPAAFVGHLQSLGEQVADALNNYLKYVGQMLVSGYTTAENTVNETPTIIKTRVINALKPEVSDASAIAATEALTEDVRARLPEHERAAFDEALAAARCINRLRDERGIYNDIWGAGIMRTAILEANRRLIEKGTLPAGELAIEADHDELMVSCTAKTPSAVKNCSHAGTGGRTQK